MEEQLSKDAVPERVYALADTAMVRVGGAHFCRALIRSVFEYDGSLSKTILRAAQPRHNPRGFVAVRRFAAVGSPAARLLLFAS